MNNFFKLSGTALMCALLSACSSNGGSAPSTGGEDPDPGSLDDNITAKASGTTVSLGAHTYDGGITGGAVAAADVPAGQTDVLNINGEVKTVELGGVTYYQTASDLDNDTGYASADYTNTAENKAVSVAFADLDYGGFLLTSAADITEKYLTGDAKNTEVSIFGNYTEPDSMPTTTATYAANIEAEVSIDGTRENDINSGEGTLAADFAANSLTGTFSDFVSESTDSTSQHPNITVGIDTTITGNTFAGTSTFTEGTFEADMSTNTVEGAFMGPEAAELVGIIEQVFSGSDGRTVHILGGFTGKKQ